MPIRIAPCKVSKSPQVAPLKVSKSPDVAFQPLAVSVKEAAALLSVSERTIWSLAQRGEIKSRKIGSRVVFPLASIRAFLNETDSSGDVE